MHHLCASLCRPSYRRLDLVTGVPTQEAGVLFFPSPGKGTPRRTFLPQVPYLLKTQKTSLNFLGNMGMSVKDENFPRLLGVFYGVRFPSGRCV